VEAEFVAPGAGRSGIPEVVGSEDFSTLAACDTDGPPITLLEELVEVDATDDVSETVFTEGGVVSIFIILF